MVTLPTTGPTSSTCSVPVAVPVPPARLKSDTLNPTAASVFAGTQLETDTMNTSVDTSGETANVDAASGAMAEQEPIESLAAAVRSTAPPGAAKPLGGAAVTITATVSVARWNAPSATAAASKLFSSSMKMVALGAPCG